MWNVLITAKPMREVGQGALAKLTQAGCQLHELAEPGPLKPAELLERLPEIDAVLAGMDAFDAAVLASPAAQHLKIISRWGVGYDAIDISAATQAGIIVAFTPGMLNETVADYTFALLLALARRVPEAQAAMRAGKWQPEWGRDVHGRTLGIVGCGGIGQAVARRAAAFNLRLLAADPVPRPEAEQLGVEFVSLERLLDESDFVALHTALLPETRGMIGEAQLRRMKSTAFLINTARGALVNEAALARALHEGWIAGAALDVFTTEPLPADNALRGAPNLLLSPHQSSYTRETGERVSFAAATAILDLMQGRRPSPVVNPDVFAAPQLRARLK